MNREQVKAVTAIVKKKFPNLTTEETVDFVTEIVDTVVNLQFKAQAQVPQNINPQLLGQTPPR